MLDPEKLLGAQADMGTHSWTERDVMLYALGLGVTDLRRVYERDLEVLPTFGALGVMLDVDTIPAMPGAGFDPSAVLHAEQEVELHRPVPTTGSGTKTVTVVGVHDKGANAMVSAETVLVDADGPLVSGRGTVFARGEGGFGGSHGTSLVPPAPVPDRAPDHVVDVQTRPDQGLLYRLSGDYNALHVDPEVAQGAGFPAPILHGMCSFGIAVTAAVDTALDGDVSAVRRMRTRFAGVAYPGDLLRTRVWRTDDGAVFDTVAASRDDAPVLVGGAVLTTASKES